jgi:hypothetical protein
VTTRRIFGYITTYSGNPQCTFDLSNYPNLTSLTTNLKVINSQNVECPNLKILILFQKSTSLDPQHYPNLMVFKGNIKKRRLKNNRYPKGSRITLVHVGKRPFTSQQEITFELQDIFIDDIVNIITSYI